MNEPNETNKPDNDEDDSDASLNETNKTRKKNTTAETKQPILNDGIGSRVCVHVRRAWNSGALAAANTRCPVRSVKDWHMVPPMAQWMMPCMVSIVCENSKNLTRDEETTIVPRERERGIKIKD